MPTAMEDSIRQGGGLGIGRGALPLPRPGGRQRSGKGLPGGSKDSDMVLLMPYLEEATDAVLAIAPPEVVLHGPSTGREG